MNKANAIPWLNVARDASTNGRLSNLSGIQRFSRRITILKPDQVSLVPEKREEVTTEGGLDAVAHAGRLAEVTAALQAAGVEVLESEVIGLVPQAAVTRSFVDLTKPAGWTGEEILESRLGDVSRVLRRESLASGSRVLYLAESVKMR